MAGRKIGVLITGDIAENGYPEFWYDTVIMYKLLLACGFPQDDVFILYGDGSHYTPPCSSNRYTLPTMPSNRFFSATLANVNAVFNAIATGNPAWNVDPADNQDFMFIWTFNHGCGRPCMGSNAPTVLCLWDTDINDQDFTNLVDSVNYSTRAICMQQCHSGGFIPFLENNQTVILTACTATEHAHPANDAWEHDTLCATSHEHGEFNFYLFASLFKRTLANFGTSINPDVAGNINFSTSMFEAFQWIKNHENVSETPQYSDLGNIGRTLHLAARRPAEVPDVFIRDSQYDFGGTPSNPSVSLTPWIDDACCRVHWRSPDIQVSNDGTNPAPHGIPGTTNYARARVSNLSNDPVNCSVSLYWADFSAGFNWPADFHSIGTTPVTVPPLGWVWTNWLSWHLPSDVSEHLCIVARVDCPQDPVGTGTGHADTLIPFDNNFSLNNVGAVTADYGEIKRFDVQIRNIFEKERVVEVSVEGVPKDFVLLGAIEEVRDMIVFGAKKIKLDMPEKSTLRLEMGPREMKKLHVVVIPLHEEKMKEATIDIIQKVDEKIIGGCTYIVRVLPPKRPLPSRLEEILKTICSSLFERKEPFEPSIKIEKIEGIGTIFAEKLIGVGIKTIDDMLEAGSTSKDRMELANKTGISQKLILEWVNLADLFRIRGISEEYSDLLEEAGVDTVVELSNRNPKNLHKKILEINEKKKLVRRPPTLNMVKDWIEQAKKLPRKIEY